MKQLLKQAIKFSFLILAISIFGCQDDDVVLPEVNSGFTYTLNEDTGTVTFINISSDAETYLWTFGDGGTSTEINPIKTYANGTYEVTLKASSVSGASGTFEDMIIISIPNPMDLPITFDDPNVAYTIETFNGTSFEILDNPDVSGTNNKASNVGAITNSGAAFEGINFDLGTQLDLTTEKTITMNFWADAPVDVLMKLEQGTGPDMEVTSSHGGTGWETASFDFDSSNKYVRITIFVDGPGTTAGTFYIDDIEQIETTITPIDGCDTDPIFGDTGSGSSTLPLDFETDVAGGSSLFEVFEADTPQLQIVSNPDQSGINTTATAAKFQAPLGGADYAGTKTVLETPFTLDNTNSTVKIMVWKSVISDVGIKFEANAASTGEIKIPNTLVNQWEEITFDFSGKIGETSSTNIDAIVIFPDFDARTQCNIVYFDNVSLSTGGSSGSEPTVAAPTPTAVASDVISVYSDAYTDVSGTDFNPGWGQSTVYSEESIVGDNTMLYTGLDYQGIVLGSAQEASAMEFLHIDYWTANSTALNTFVISTGPVEMAKALTVPTGGGWTSVDIPIGDFSGVNLADVIQMKFDGNGDIYLDNIYFYKTGGGSATEPAIAAPAPTAAASDVISVYSDAYTDVSGTDFNPGWGQSTVYSEESIVGDNTMLYTGLDYQGIVLGSAQEASAMEFLHIDYWTANSTALNTFVISTGPVEMAKALTVPTGGGWTSVDIPIGDFSGVNLADVIQMKFDGNGDIYLDNIYFYKTGGGSTYNLSLPIDFETSGFGASWTWNVFENDTNDPLEFVANPNASGSNTSSTVAKITALQTGAAWVGTETAHGEMGITWDLSASNAIIKIMVYKTIISDVGIKLANPTGGAQGEIKVPNTKINEWEELTFDFSDRIGNGLDGSTNIDQIVVFPDFNLDGRTSDNVVYFDNIRFTSN